MLQMCEVPKNVECKEGFFQVSESLVSSCVNRATCNVFKGTFNGQVVAVKIFLKNAPPTIHQEDHHWEKLIKLRDDHVVQYHFFGIQNNVQ
jgi:hypothetical protein